MSQQQMDLSSKPVPLKKGKACICCRYVLSLLVMTMSNIDLDVGKWFVMLRFNTPVVTDSVLEEMRWYTTYLYPMLK